MRQVIITIVCFLNLLAVGQVFAQKKKVLLTDFVNQNKEKKYEFLGNTIPEAFEEPLEKTGSFQVFTIDTDELAWQKEGESNEGEAIRIGRATTADIVIIGSFAIVDETLRIRAKALHVKNVEVIAMRSQQAKTDGTMFDTIDELAAAMSAEIDEKLSRKQAIRMTRPVTPTRYKSRSYSTMLGYSLLYPGVGHLYANQQRGYFYATVFSLVALGFIINAFDYQFKRDQYESALDDFDAKYNAAQDAKVRRATWSYFVVGVYAFTFVDMLITGRSYEYQEYSQSSLGHRFKFEFSGDKAVLAATYRF